MVNAIIMEPNTINGDRRNSRKKMFSPDCTWLMSPVSRVISVDGPTPSSSVNDSLVMCSNTACRSPVENPVAARAAKYCAVIENASPAAPSSTSSPHIRPM